MRALDLIGETQFGVIGDEMKKLITKIDDIEEDIFISKSLITLKEMEFKLEDQNGTLVILDPSGNATYIDDIIDLGNNIVRIEVEGFTIDVVVEDPLLSAVSGTEDVDINIASPLAGSISSVLVNVGDMVEKGDVILIISAMKMENKITAKSSGKIKYINCNEGDQVNKGAILIEFEK
jgi:biotin carboxyl carrier protein